MIDFDRLQEIDWPACEVLMVLPWAPPSRLPVRSKPFVRLISTMWCSRQRSRQRRRGVLVVESDKLQQYR
jgi:hypothetical protein